MKQGIFVGLLVLLLSADAAQAQDAVYPLVVNLGERVGVVVDGAFLPLGHCLAAGEQAEGAPAVSPDGTQVAYVVTTNAAPVDSLTICDITDTDAMPTQHGTGDQLTAPDWSPSGITWTSRTGENGALHIWQDGNTARYDNLPLSQGALVFPAYWAGDVAVTHHSAFDAFDSTNIETLYAVAPDGTQAGRRELSKAWTVSVLELYPVVDGVAALYTSGDVYLTNTDYDAPTVITGGQMVATGGGPALTLGLARSMRGGLTRTWTLATPDGPVVLDFDGPPGQIAFAPDGTGVAYLGDDGVTLVTADGTASLVPGTAPTDARRGGLRWGPVTWAVRNGT